MHCITTVWSTWTTTWTIWLYCSAKWKERPAISDESSINDPVRPITQSSCAEQRREEFCALVLDDIIVFFFFFGYCFLWCLSWSESDDIPRWQIHWPIKCADGTSSAIWILFWSAHSASNCLIAPIARQTSFRVCVWQSSFFLLFFFLFLFFVQIFKASESRPGR